MTLAETQQLIAFAREQRVQELSVGDTHVLFSSAAFVLPPDAPVKTTPSPAPTDPGTGQPRSMDAEEAQKLMDDPDLFLHADGGPVVPS